MAVENHGELGCERSAEAAASLSVRHLDELQTLDPGKELASRQFDSELAQTVAAIMKSNFGREARAQLGDPQFVHEEIREFVASGRQVIRELLVFCSVE